MLCKPYFSVSENCVSETWQDVFLRNSFWISKPCWGVRAACSSCLRVICIVRPVVILVKVYPLSYHGNYLHITNLSCQGKRGGAGERCKEI